MKNIETLVENFLTSHYGESFEVKCLDNKIYDPRTLDGLTARLYLLDERIICVVRNDKIDFDKKLLSTIQSLFNLNSSDLEPILEKWFYEKIHIS